MNRSPIEVRRPLLRPRQAGGARRFALPRGAPFALAIAVGVCMLAMMNTGTRRSSRPVMTNDVRNAAPPAPQRLVDEAPLEPPVGAPAADTTMEELPPSPSASPSASPTASSIPTPSPTPLSALAIEEPTPTPELEEGEVVEPTPTPKTVSLEISL